MNAADLVVDYLVREGVRHVFGVGGANIEDMFAAVQRRRPAIQAVLTKHEHGGGTAADAYGRVGGGLGVVLATSGGAAMNLAHSLAEAYASYSPMLAIVGEPPMDLQGLGAFQDTSGRGEAVDAQKVLRPVSTSCARVASADELPRALDDAFAAAFGERPGPAVLLLSKDVQRAEVARPLPERTVGRVRARPEIDAATLRRAVELLAAGPVLIVAGDEVARSGAREELALLADALDADVAVAPDGRDAFDNDDPHFAGVAGAMGHARVEQALARARVCVLAGTRMPFLARFGLEAALADKVLVSLGPRRPFVSAVQSLHVDGELRACLGALARAAVEPGRARPATRRGAPVRTDAPFVASVPSVAPARLRCSAVLESVARFVPEGGVVLVDAGNTGASSVHHLSVPRGGRWLLALGMAGMGYSFGAALGAACATRRRCFVVAGDGAFYMNGFEIHTAVEHALPITYVILDNRAHGMCLVRERLLLRDNAGYNSFRRSHIGAGLAAMFPGLSSCDCETLGELERALAHAADRPGPSAICAQLADVEVPPFATFQRLAGDGVTTVARGGGDEDD